MKPMLKRHHQLYGRYPRQASFDGGFATQDNLRWAKKQGIVDVAFAKKGRLKVSEMVRSSWVYRQFAAFSGWNRRLHLDAQASLRCQPLYLEGLGAFSAVPASFGSQLQLAGAGSTSPLGSQSFAS